MAKPRILFTTPILEHPPAGGPALRIENTIKALHQIAEVHVVSRVSRPYLGGSAGEAFYRSMSYAFSYAPSVAGISENRWMRGVQRILRGRTAVRNDAELLVSYMKRNGIDVLWAGYGNISFDVMARVKEIAPSIRIVCDTDSVWSRFVLRKLPYVTSPAERRKIEAAGRRKEDEERAWVNLCDVTTAVSEVDAGYYRSLAAEPERVRIFSNVIDIDSYVEVPPAPIGHKTPNVYLAGTFGNDGPMDQAARWLVGNVLPIVLREIPEMHLYLVGVGGEVSLADLAGPGITITGKLPSVLPYLRHADVALVPLFFESGTRFKILEAGACGIPIVSTTLGAEGLPLKDGKEILIADEPEAFAQAIVRLVRDRTFAAAMAGECRNFVEENYGIRRLVREAETILAALKASNGEPRRTGRRN
jgi:glycosyltransferase involved in cell wall biosynthesis